MLSKKRTWPALRWISRPSSPLVVMRRDSGEVYHLEVEEAALLTPSIINIEPKNVIAISLARFRSPELLLRR